MGGDGYEYERKSCNIFGCETHHIFTHPTELSGVDYADNKRVILVAAVGNEKREVSPYTGSILFPGRYPSSFDKVISVSGLSQDGTQLYDTGQRGTNYGKVEISAPGMDIYSTIWSGDPCISKEGVIINNEYCSYYGTSMAAPMVSAFAGLLLALNSNLHRETILTEMCANATPISISGNPEENKKYVGCGRINLGDTLKSVSDSLPLPIISNECGGEEEPVCPAGRWFDKFSFQFTVEGGQEPFHWSYDNGSLPPNTTLDPDTGILSGGPT